MRIFWISALLLCSATVSTSNANLAFDLLTQPDEVSTSFENSDSGEFKTLKTKVGTWSNVKGKVIVDMKHARSGRRCLQIAGGEQGSSIVLELTNRIKKERLLTFWAERWTSRTPFRFRIEKFSNGTWEEIFNGDKQVKVGRSFRSQVKIRIANGQIRRLRFSVKSPDKTGVLLDDLTLAATKPMKVVSVDVVPLTLPALVGVDQNAIAKLRIRTAGTLNPISMVDLEASLVGESSFDTVESVQPFFGEDENRFRWDRPFAAEQTPRQGDHHRFSGNQVLSEGDNFVWLACKLRKNADIDRTVSAQFHSINLTLGGEKRIDGPPTTQRLGVSVRKSGEDGVHTYRIPGLVTTNKGTLIGVYDVRWNSAGDLPGNIDVGMSRSIDGGRTWEPMKIIMDMGDEPKWRYDGVGDPAVLVDRVTGTIWVAATWSHGNRSWRGSGPGLEPQATGQWMMTKSDDDGKTWSAPINITKQVKKPEWSFLLQGPGKGIMMKDGTLVFPAQYQDPPSKNKRLNRLPHSTIIYSRDNGATWNIGTGACDDTTEAQVIELANGELMLNCRYNRSSKRAIMTTQDMGKTWREHSTHASTLVEPGACMASLINVGHELGWRGIRSNFDNQFLLFSNPDSLTGRNHMTIKASKNAGKKWLEKHQLLLDEQTGRGYSCMTMIDAETVGILYEGSQADMTFQRVKINEILNPPKNQKTKNPALLNENR